ncbi:hypothetical protein ACHHYP_05265 [Achlya hypogyna]|uniref:Uncharacterized protein n=1 Tax=Achlya hypogyna TaxID=1202772 RepID=A0A1V9YY66_ACHHY|nr:hypothetical protein ACHHYP_05265 [Achlya hypogyna]
MAPILVAPHATLKGVACTQRKTGKSAWRPPPPVAATYAYSGIVEHPTSDSTLPLQCVVPLVLALLLWSGCHCFYDAADLIHVSVLAASLAGLAAIKVNTSALPSKQALDMREIVVVNNPDVAQPTSLPLIDSEDETDAFGRRTYSTQSTIDSDADDDDCFRYSVASTVAVEDDEEADLSYLDLHITGDLDTLPPVDLEASLPPVAEEAELVTPAPKTAKRKLPPATRASKFRAVVLTPPPRPARKLQSPALQRMLDEVNAMQEESERLMANMAALGVHGPCTMNERLRRWSVTTARPTPPL